MISPFSEISMPAVFGKDSGILPSKTTFCN
jgi:hypothetical protein